MSLRDHNASVIANRSDDPPDEEYDDCGMTTEEAALCDQFAMAVLPLALKNAIALAEDGCIEVRDISITAARDAYHTGHAMIEVRRG